MKKEISTTDLCYLLASIGNKKRNRPEMSILDYFYNEGINEGEFGQSFTLDDLSYTDYLKIREYNGYYNANCRYMEKNDTMSCCFMYKVEADFERNKRFFESIREDPGYYEFVW